MDYLRNLLFILFLFILSCQNDPTFEHNLPKEKMIPVVPTALPMNEIKLNDLSAFDAEAVNWSIVGNVYADLDKEKSIEVNEGNGVLVNQPSSANEGNIMTKWEHGDIDLELDFMVPQRGNSGLYLQGRYELQILDSWNKESVNSNDCGGIYQRWDDAQPEGKKGYEGTAPKVNACKAPGLWQNFKIEFQAPRFDSTGNKIQNAVFKKVYLNDYLIHENVELTGPTRGAVFSNESPTGPLFIQGDHGPVAFKNIKYKIYTQKQLSLTEITYEFFDGKDDKLPDFSTLTASKSGQTDSIDVNKVSDKGEGYRLRFKGKLIVPVSGDYLFSTRIDDGGELFIDGKSIVFNEGEPGYGEERGLVNLSEGAHDFMITYYQEVWSALLVIDYEGPGMIKQSLASKMPVYPWHRKRPPILAVDLETPEMLRAFVNHKGVKKTNILSVGDPKGVHYSYDLRGYNLIKTWKGQFADVTQMWQGRGEPQLLQPMNMSIDLTEGLPIAALKNENTAWPKFIPDDFQFKGYEVDAQNRPIFLYEYKSASFKDQIFPSEDGERLIRTIQKIGNGPDIFLRIAAAANIQLMSNGLYNVDGQYYVKGSNLIIRNENELIAKLGDITSYEIKW